MGGSEKALDNVRASSQDASTANIAEMTFANNDETELAALGKKQQLRVCPRDLYDRSLLTMRQRNFGFFGVLRLRLYVDDNLGRGLDVSDTSLISSILRTQHPKEV